MFKNLFTFKNEIPEVDPFDLFLNEFFPWVKEIYSTQEEIAKLSDKGFYEKVQSGKDFSGKEISFPTYRSSEIYFWNPVTRWLYEDAQKRTISKTLDIGCGYGTLSLFTKRITGCSSFMVDFIDAYMSNKLIKKYSLNFRVANIELEPIPFKKESFDTILFTEVLEHLNFNPIPTLRKIVKVLKKDGLLYITTPDAEEWGKITTFYNNPKVMPFPNKRKKIIDAHIYQYNKKELFSLLKETGLEVVKFDYSPGYKYSGRHFCLVCKRKI